MFMRYVSGRIEHSVVNELDGIILQFGLAEFEAKFDAVIRYRAELQDAILKVSKATG